MIDLNNGYTQPFLQKRIAPTFGSVKYTVDWQGHKKEYANYIVKLHNAMKKKNKYHILMA